MRLQKRVTEMINATEYLDGLNKRGIHPGLFGIQKLCDALNNPEKDLKVIHVVGTNGKGSTALFISEILKASGLSVGVYSSPAVFDEREIIKVNGKSISKSSYEKLVDKIAMANTFGCTRFEVETVLAFLYFKEKKCDVVVLEAGMGGTFDATNVAPNAIASVFTAIGIDHSEYLGSTISEIASSKAGVIKNGSITFVTSQTEEAETVIQSVSEKQSCEYVMSDYKLATGIKYRKNGTVFNYKGMTGIKLTLPGTYQIQNAALAIDVALGLRDCLKSIKRKVNITTETIKLGLEKAREEGRFEIICERPTFVLDGAHNEPASVRFRENVLTYFTNKKIIYIMGMLKDKECDRVISNTADLAQCIFTVATPKKERTMSAIELAELVKPYNRMVTAVDSIEEAVELALMMADKDTVIIAFGSLSHLKKIKEVVSEGKKIKKDTHGIKNV